VLLTYFTGGYPGQIANKHSIGQTSGFAVTGITRNVSFVSVAYAKVPGLLKIPS
jgi:hypothetical protein